jgi:hypothetical protein
MNSDRKIRQLKFLPKLILAASILSLIVSVVISAILWWEDLQYRSVFSSLPPNFQVGLAPYIFNKPWLSLFLSLLLGLPEGLWHKHHLLQKKEDVICQLLHTGEKDLSWSATRAKFGECLPVMASHIFAIAVIYWLGLAVAPAAVAPGVSAFLWYPQYKDACDEAGKRLIHLPESAFAEDTPFT